MHTIKWRKNNGPEQVVKLRTQEAAQFLYDGLHNYPPVTHVTWTMDGQLVSEMVRNHA